MERIYADVVQVRKRQRAHHGAAVAAIEKIEGELQHTLDQLEAEQKPGPEEVASQLTRLQAKLAESNIPKTLLAQQKTFHAAVSKLGKSIDKSLDGGLQDAVCTEPLADQPGLLQRAVLSHFHRAGHVDLARTLTDEALRLEQPLVEESRGKQAVNEHLYESLHQIVKALQAKDFSLALEWIDRNKEALQTRQSPLEFALYRAEYLQLLREGDAAIALRYAKKRIAPFGEVHGAEVTRLMGALMYTRQIDRSPYADLVSGKEDGQLDPLQLFVREVSALEGLPRESLLHLAVLAGCTAMPAHLQMSSLMATKGGFDKVGGQMQVEVDLGPEFQFHSVFVCPVSREQSTPDNPPVQLPCGHVICRLSMMKLVRANSRMKCPYCPTDAHLDDVKYLNFF